MCIFNSSTFKFQFISGFILIHTFYTLLIIIKNFCSQRSGTEVWSSREVRGVSLVPRVVRASVERAGKPGGSIPWPKPGHRTSWSGAIRETGISRGVHQGRRGFLGYHQGLGQVIQNIRGPPNIGYNWCRCSSQNGVRRGPGESIPT